MGDADDDDVNVNDDDDDDDDVVRGGRCCGTTTTMDEDDVDDGGGGVWRRRVNGRDGRDTRDAWRAWMDDDDEDEDDVARTRTRTRTREGRDAALREHARAAYEFALGATRCVERDAPGSRTTWRRSRKRVESAANEADHDIFDARPTTRVRGAHDARAARTHAIAIRAQLRRSRARDA